MSTYTVTLAGSAPWGFRLQGGKDFNMPLTISRITPGSKAASGNLTQGDIIVAIDGVNTDGMTHLDAQNKIKSASFNLALTMQRSKRPVPVSMTAPRIDTSIPVIPHQKGHPYQINGGLATCAETNSYHCNAQELSQSSSTQKSQQYNSPVGLYSAETLREMAMLQERAKSLGSGKSLGTSVQHAAVSTSTAAVALSASAAALPSQLPAELQLSNQVPEQPAEPASVGSSHVSFGSPPEPQAVSQADPVAHEAHEAPVLPPEGPRHLSLAASTISTALTAQSRNHVYKKGPPPTSALEALSITPHFCTRALPKIKQSGKAKKVSFTMQSSSSYRSQYQTPGISSQYAQQPPMHQAPYTQQPVHIQSIPPSHQAPPMQQSSIHIPVGPPPAKVVSTATIVPTAYPSAPVPEWQAEKPQRGVHFRDVPVQAPAPAPAPPSAPVHGYVPTPPAPAPGFTQSSSRPPWVMDDTFAQKFDPGKTTTTSVKVQPLPTAAPPPPAYIPNHSPAPAAPSPASGQGPAPFIPAPFSPVARGVAQRAERFAASNRTPMCGSCNNIIRGPFLVALGRSWHPEEFNCHYCHTSLADVSFVEEQNNVYCENCYREFFAPTCARCNSKIMGEVMHALRQTWHTTCFVCAACGKPFGNSLFHMEDGEPYCEKDYVALFSTKCHGCDFPVEAGDKFIEALGYTWHDTCFVCTVCHVNLEGQPFYSKKDKPLCKKHAHAINV
ncbi:LIM domain-binding protein 3a isoform 1-T1 [Clarias gariepinus]